MLEEDGTASNDQEVKQLSKTFSEILESGESTSARLDEPIEAAENMAINAYAQIYGSALPETFDKAVLRKALLATSSGIGREQTESEDQASE